jgi:DNA-directed RNA polymerase specialized sigma24 family protein
MTRWDRLIREHGPSVYTTAWRILGHEGEAEAVMQDVFRDVLAVLKARDASCWAMLLRLLAAYRALDRLRSGEVPFGEDAEGGLRSAMSELPAREAAAFSLRYLCDVPEDQIAEACRLPPDDVTADLVSARARLESLLGAAARV